MATALVASPCWFCTSLACRKRACAGMLTGGIGQFVASPTDVVKIRIQADGRLKLQGKEARYRGAMHAFRSIAQKEGMAGERRTSHVWHALHACVALSVIFITIIIVSARFEICGQCKRCLLSARLTLPGGLPPCRCTTLLSRPPS